MNINEIKESLRYILIPGIKQPITPYLRGKPGIGKSDLVRQLVKEFTKKSGEEFLFIDLRLSQLESADIRGIPVPDMDNNICKWFPPEFLPFEDSKTFKNTYGILLLDEFNRARSDVLQAAFQLVLDRKVGMHKLLDTWFIIAAGNLGQEDKTDVNEMDSALKNRFIHLEVEAELNTWIDWARENKIHDDVIGYIQSKSSHLYFTVKEEDNLFVTPRSWEKFSDILKQNPTVSPKEICMTIGQPLIYTAAGHFLQYLESKEIISPSDIVLKYKSVKSKLRTMGRDQILMLNNEIVHYTAKKTNANSKESEESLKIMSDNIALYAEEKLELDNRIAFLKELAKACVAEGSKFMQIFLREHNSLSQEILNTLQPNKVK